MGPLRETESVKENKYHDLSRELRKVKAMDNYLIIGYCPKAPCEDVE